MNRVDAYIGEPGIGKTVTTRVIAYSMGWHCKVFHFANQAFEDITGLPIIKDVEVDGKVQKVASFAKSEAVPGAVWGQYDDDNQGTLGVIDDGHRTPPTCQGQLVELIDGHLNGEAIDPRCVLVFTGNPPEANIITGQAIDKALEDRMNVHIVQPTTAELLDVWSKIMPQRIYQFLMMTPAFVPTISARAWMGVAYDVQDLLDAGADSSEAVNDVTCEFINAGNVETKLRQFLVHGDDPFHYPLLGRSFLDATPQTMSQYGQLVQRWLSENQRGLLGESKNDLLRTLSTLTAEDVRDHTKTFSANITQFMEWLVEGRCNDMAKNLLSAIFAAPAAVADEVSNQIESTKVLNAMTDAYDRFRQLREKHYADAAAS